jgi:tripartite-type tricarboxylate transporter receptor subunit TctC
MNTPKRIASSVAIAALALAPAIAPGQSYPAKPVRIVTAEAGGGADFIARVLALALTPALGQQVIVENRGGASGAIAMETVARAAPDGYTLLLFSNGMWTLPFLQKVPYDPVRDYAPVCLVDRIPNILVVHPSLPARSVKDLVSLAKARPGQLNYGAGSNGSTPHLAGEMFRLMAGIDVMRVSYRGTGPAMIDLVAGQLHYMFPNAAAATPHLKSGRLRALAVTSTESSPLLPDLPTVAATVPGYSAESSHNLFAPAATPRPIVAKLNEEIVRALQRPDVKERFLKGGAEPVGSTPEQLASTMGSEMVRVAKVIKATGIKVDY